MFIGGLKDCTTDEDLNEAFAGFGPIEKLELIKDKETNKCRGFAFITYEDYDAVDKCISKYSK